MKMVHYDDTGNPNPLEVGDEVIVLDDGQGYAGTIGTVMQDDSKQLWYIVDFPKQKGESQHSYAAKCRVGMNSTF